MTITIGSFTTKALLAQPFGYEGDARGGMTARTFTVSGLLTAAQWQALLSEYTTWRNARINDQDTLLSGTVGTTVSLTIASANGVSVTGLACWFIEPPAGEQTGTYVSATARLIDAAQALAVLQRAQTRSNERARADAANVDCALVTANLNRRRAETACELTALQAGLAGDFATQDIQRQQIEAAARSTASAAQTTALAAIKAAEANVELLDRQATATGRATNATNLAAADLALEAQNATARAAAYTAGSSNLQAVQAAAISSERSEGAARIAALNSGSSLNDLRDTRALLALYDKYLGEDLPDLGTLTVGTVVVKLTRPMTTYSDGPQVAMTAAGGSYITGPLAAHETRQIEGVITSGTFDTLLSWYATTISTLPAVGSWFPTTAPVASAEPFLVAGAKGTRYSVSLEMKKIC